MQQLPQSQASILVQPMLAIIMLAVTFEVTLKDLKALPAQWKRILAGSLMQETLLLASSPGGNLSQFFVVHPVMGGELSLGLTFMMLGRWIAQETHLSLVRLRKAIQQCVPFLLVTLLLGSSWSLVADTLAYDESGMRNRSSQGLC